MKKTYLIVLLTLLLLAFSACGRETEYDTSPEDENGIEVLTVLVPQAFRGLLFEVEQSMTRALAEEGRSFRLERIIFRPEEIDEISVRLNVMLMAGQAYDMFFANDAFPMMTMARAGFLADIYTIIDRCPYSDRDDFHAAALDAFTINNGLYGFPLSFAFEFVGINADLPDEFIDRFAGYDNITYTQLMQIYADLQNRHGSEFSHLRIGNSFVFQDHIPIIQGMIESFVDFENHTANLVNDRFISDLATIQQLYSSGGLAIGRGYWMNLWVHGPFLRRIAEENVFHFTNDRGLDAWTAFSPMPYFVHFIPIADEQGRLRTLAGWDSIQTIHISRERNEDLAWEFTRHMLSSLSDTGNLEWAVGIFSMATPIERSCFEPHFLSTGDMFRDLVHQHYRRRYNVAAVADTQGTRDTMVARMAHYSAMPMAPPIHFIPAALIANHVEMLLNGLISPEEAAQRMQNAVTLWLIE